MSRTIITPIVFVCVATASAQLMPPPENDPALISSKMVDGQVEMRTIDGDPVLMPRNIVIHDDARTGTSVTPTIEFQAQPTGFDLLVTYENKTSETMGLGRLRLGVFTLGNNITFPDFRAICSPRKADYNTFRAQSGRYPRNMYSPAWVIANDELAVGVSIQYPIMEYKHEVRLMLQSPDGRRAEGEGGRGWMIELRLSNLGGERGNAKLVDSGKIEPGQRQQYIISVRVTDHPHEWVRTLVPYRTFFRNTYGGVRYARDPRPVNAVSIANEWQISPDNLRGYLPRYRPDLNGWTRLITDIDLRHGWPRVMVWVPTGMYDRDLENIFPYQFTTGWMDDPELATAVDQEDGFPVIARTKDLGLWWGRSLQVADQWNDDTLEDMDPDLPEHVTAAFAEMDLSQQAGATIIGLDTFTTDHTPIWKLYSWLKTLQDRYPKVRFCIEPRTCDILHTMAPTFFRGYADRSEPARMEDINILKNPFYLADFLLPGHETWGGMRYDGYTRYFGYSVSDEEVRRDVADIASKGYVPVVFTRTTLLKGVAATQSWLYTVPEDLQIDISSEWALHTGKRREILDIIRHSRQVEVARTPHNQTIGLPPGISRDDLTQALDRARGLHRAPSPPMGPDSQD